MDKEFHISFSYQEDLPEEIVAEFIDLVTVDGLSIRSESREIGVYATIEYALPTIIVAYLSKPYFEAFLKEAGKDHYQLLKKGLIILFKRIFGKNSEKRNVRRWSTLFSIKAQMNDGQSIKFVFPEGIKFEEYERSLEKLHELLSNHYELYPGDSITKMVNTLQVPSNSVYIEYSSNDECWVLIDPLIEAKKARETRKNITS